MELCTQWKHENNPVHNTEYAYNFFSILCYSILDCPKKATFGFVTSMAYSPRIHKLVTWNSFKCIALYNLELIWDISCPSRCDFVMLSCAVCTDSTALFKLAINTFTVKRLLEDNITLGPFGHPLAHLHACTHLVFK